MKNRAANHSWTDDEIDIVRRDYKGTNASAQTIADHLGVSFHSVKGQVQKLGISFHPDRKKWSPEQDDLLRKLMPQLAPGTIAHRMNRSVNSVVVRSKRLRIYRRARDGWYTKREVCEILGVDHKWVQSRIDSGALIATYHNGCEPQKNGGASWHIKENDLSNFIKNYPHELKGRNVDIIQIVDLLIGIRSDEKYKGDC